VWAYILLEVPERTREPHEEDEGPLLLLSAVPDPVCLALVTSGLDFVAYKQCGWTRGQTQEKLCRAGNGGRVQQTHAEDVTGTAEEVFALVSSASDPID
jgi:hypothetical protein